MEQEQHIPVPQYHNNMTKELHIESGQSVPSIASTNKLVIYD